ncbi:MAG: hypothetical protein RL261_2301 [Pseudomonadota bacterium]
MKRKKKSKAKSPLIRLVGLEVAVAATGLAGSLTAAAAPGDLDPTFGDVGRYSSLHQSRFPDWSVDVQADDAVLLGGGGEYCYYGCYEDYFVGRLLPNGTPDASFAAATLESTFVRDTALQPDGRLVGVGVKDNKLQVFRLRPDGTLDPEFGLGGIVLISDGSGTAYEGHSVIVDPDGHIVVAGARGSTLLVARLLANGTLDATFGTGGVYLASTPGGYGGSAARIARAPGGGYRVTAHGPQTPVAGGPSFSCNVFGLTDTGVLETGFGAAGIAAAPAPAQQGVGCFAVAVQADGRILLGGRQNDAIGSVFLRRLLANGATDPGFSPGPEVGQLASVTAIAAGSGGSIFVAGPGRAGFSGALVVRMLADGTLDRLFGRAGVTTLDLKARRAGFPSISDMKVTANDALVVAGNSYYPGSGVFVARLLGNVAGGSPGVISMNQQRLLATEQAGRAVLSVRRTGGSQGAVAVSYSARDFPSPPADGAKYAPGLRATGGADYTGTTGRLTWADGDVSERQIEVPIASDTNAEEPEFFEVVLESPEGGVGLGAFGADVEIAGASYPFGDLTIQANGFVVTEGAEASFSVSRNYYSQGAVSVTVRIAPGGSATPGTDFHSPGRSDWQDVVLTWGDGDTGAKFVSVPVDSDQAKESGETFTLELASPTGGAMLGAQKAASVFIVDPPSPTSDSGGSTGSKGGGGSFGWLGALLLGLGGLRRRRPTGNS